MCRDHRIGRMQQLFQVEHDDEAFADRRDPLQVLGADS
jgi:hypothetical protein